MNSRKLRFVLILTGLLSATGCGPRATTATLVGTYRLEHRVGAKSHGVETLILRANGTYTQTFIPSRKGPTLTNSNKWEYRDGTLWLQNALEIPDPRLDIRQYPPKREDAGLGVGTYGGITICKDADLGLYYRKVP